MPQTKEQQTARRRARVAAGLCHRCGKPRHPDSIASCAKCLLVIRLAVRKCLGFKVYKPGHRGRTPICQKGI